MAQPNNETFKMKVRLTKKQERLVNLAAFAFMSVITLFSILINQI